LARRRSIYDSRSKGLSDDRKQLLIALETLQTDHEAQVKQLMTFVVEQQQNLIQQFDTQQQSLMNLINEQQVEIKKLQETMNHYEKILKDLEIKHSNSLSELMSYIH